MGDERPSMLSVGSERYEQSRVFEEGDYVCSFPFHFMGYACNVSGPDDRQHMSIHLDDDIEHFTRVVHSAAYEVQLVRDAEVADAERAAESVRRSIKYCDDHIRFQQQERAKHKAELAEAQKRKREAKKVPTKIARPTRVNGSKD